VAPYGPIPPAPYHPSGFIEREVISAVPVRAPEPRPDAGLSTLRRQSLCDEARSTPPPRPIRRSHSAPPAGPLISGPAATPEPIPMQTNDPLKDLELLIRSRYGLILLETAEPER